MIRRATMMMTLLALPAAACGADDEGGGAGGVCIDPGACVAEGDCPANPTLGLGLEASVATDEAANPEIVDLVPGQPGRAVVISSVANSLSDVTFDKRGLTIVRSVPIATGSDTSETSSITVSPDGTFGAITVAEADCGLGRVLFVDLDPGSLGTVLGTAPVGYNPDSGAFSADGRYFVTADEDDREDRPCKPADRQGGTVTVIDLSAGPAGPTVAQTLAVDHALDSEPEGVAITDTGTVIVTIQETSELGFFDLADVPTATLELLALPADGEPDGVVVAHGGTLAVAALENTDGLVTIDLGTRAVVQHYTIAGSGDVPDSYNRDERKVTKQHEPQTVTLAHSEGATFVLVAAQESHAVLAYRLSTTGQLTFDSVTPVGIGWEGEANGREGSAIGPEGVRFDSELGLGVVASEREGSISLFSSAIGRARVCP